MKKYLLTGFVALFPIVITILIVRWIFNVLTDPLAGVMEHVILSLESYLHMSPDHHHMLAIFLSRVLALIIVVVAVFLLGFFGQRFLLNSLLNFGQKILQKIPLVRTIFQVTQDLTKALFAGEKKAFQETVILPFPSKDHYTIGFKTGDVPACINKHFPEAEVAVFAPTAPHPISGFLLLLPKDKVPSIDMSTEDAFKFLISCGMLHPEDKKK